MKLFVLALSTTLYMLSFAEPASAEPIITSFLLTTALGNVLGVAGTQLFSFALVAALTVGARPVLYA